MSTLTSSILQMGLIWHIALTTGSSSLLSPGIVSRLSADCFVRSPCGRRCRQTAFETCSHRRRPLRCRGGRRLGDCLVGRQLACVVNTHRPVSPRSWHFVLHAGLPIPHAPSRPARASRSPIGSNASDSVRRIHSWRRARGSDLSCGGHYRHDCPRRAGGAFRFSSCPRRSDKTQEDSTKPTAARPFPIKFENFSLRFRTATS